MSRDQAALAGLAIVLAACAGNGAAGTCEQALEHTAALAVARASPDDGPSPHAEAHQAALVRATGDTFLARCRERSAENRAELAGEGAAGCSARLCPSAPNPVCAQGRKSCF